MNEAEMEAAEHELAVAEVLLGIGSGDWDNELADLSAAVSLRRNVQKAERAKINLELCRKGTRMMVRRSIRPTYLAGAMITVTSVVDGKIHATIDPEFRKGTFNKACSYSFPPSALDLAG